MRLELARACLEDAHEATRKAGAALLAGVDLPEVDFLLFRSLVDVSDQVGSKARDVLIHRYPWLLLEPSFVRPVPKSLLESQYGRAWAALRQGIRRVVREIQPSLEDLKRVLAVPGAVPDVIEELQAYGCDALAEELRNLATCGNSRLAGNRQILVAPTYRCNLTCSYCYAKDYASVFPPDMSLEHLTLLLSWAAAQGVGTILLGGGEPTVYCHLPQLLRMARERGMSVHVTSNCLYSTSLREEIAPPAVGKLVAHYDQERLGASDASAKLFRENLQAARAREVEVIIRYTLTAESGPAEWRPVMDLARRLSIQQINYALAFCGSKGLNAHFRCQDAVGAAGGLLENILTGLWRDAADRGLRLQLCKPIPLCALTPESLRRMSRDGGMRPACAIHRDDFTRNLTINPDLSTFPCNGIAIRGPRITELPCLADAGRHHGPAIRELMRRPFAGECERCVLWYRGFCQGACLAEHYWMSRVEKGQPGERN